MSDIPEEIRKMFPNQPIHKLDIDDNGDLHILASFEPLSNDPDFEHMPIEQVNQYLRDHGFDPEQVRLNGKILVGALIENHDLRARALTAERELAELKERTRWIPVGERQPTRSVFHPVLRRSRINGQLYPDDEVWNTQEMKWEDERLHKDRVAYWFDVQLLDPPETPVHNHDNDDKE